MRNIALTLMYDGTAYHGWQVQKRDVTVAETLEKALAHVVGHPVKCTGAGRTDAGVHAERYVANFRTTSSIPCDRIPLAVNTRLPGDIVVTKATQVPEDFNAIGSCQRKEYTYRIYNSRIRNAFLVNRVWFYPKHLDEEVMARAAQHFVGTHDFACVRSVGTETKTTVRTALFTIWSGPWWEPASTPQRENSPPMTSPACWKGATAPMPAPQPLRKGCI